MPVTDDRDYRAIVRRVELLKVWTNEDGKRFVFADDLFYALFPEYQPPDFYTLGNHRPLFPKDV